MQVQDLVITLNQCEKHQKRVVGDAAYALGELSMAGLNVPKGFIVTVASFDHFVKHNRLISKINHLLGSMNPQDSNSVKQVSSHIGHMVNTSEIPEEVAEEVFRHFEELSLSKVDVYADKDACFEAAGESAVLEKVREVWAQSYSPRNLLKNYKSYGRFDHIFPAVLVLEKMKPQKSGVLYTADPKEKNTLIIEAGSSGYRVKKPSVILGGNAEFEIIQKDGLYLSEQEIREVSGMGLQVEGHSYFPKKIEWVYSGGTLHVTGITDIHDIQRKDAQNEPIPQPAPQKVLHGIPVRKGVGIGRVKRLTQGTENLAGCIAIISNFKPQFKKILTNAKAVLIEDDKNYVSSDFSIPAIKGVHAQGLEEEMLVTVNGSTGDVYSGSMRISLPQEKKTTGLQVFVDLSDGSSNEESDGIFFSPEEAIRTVGIHPKVLEKEGKEKLLSEKIYQVLANVQKPVWYRLADLTSKELRGLSGGKEYEEQEESGVLGYHGATRILRDATLLRIELAAISKLIQRDSEVSLAVPFVRSVHELVQFKRLLFELGLSKKVKLFMMIDMPSQVISLHEYISSGAEGFILDAESLAMLTMGGDLGNPLTRLSVSLEDPSVLWSIEKVTSVSGEYGVPVGVYSRDSAFLMDIAGKVISWGGNVLIGPRDQLRYVQKMVQIESERRMPLEVK